MYVYFPWLNDAEVMVHLRLHFKLYKKWFFYSGVLEWCSTEDSPPSAFVTEIKGQTISLLSFSTESQNHKTFLLFVIDAANK